jgi:hypothetical protein
MGGSDAPSSSTRDMTITRNTRKITRDFPYQVAIRVPAGAMDTAIADMRGFCSALALTYRTYLSPKRKAGAWDQVTWCFANPMQARLFHQRFGGDRVTVTGTDSSPAEPPESGGFPS